MKINGVKIRKIRKEVVFNKIFQPFFCPFCEVLFIDNINTNNKKNDKSADNTFRCSQCKKDFTEETFSEKKRKRSDFKLPSLYIEKENVQDIIKDNILKLSHEGYSQRDIIKITKFPKSKVEEYTKASNDILITVSIKRFKKEYLKITEDLDKDQQIVSAIEFGCTVRQIQELFQVGNDRINRLRKNQTMKILRKNKISIKKERVAIHKLY